MTKKVLTLSTVVVAALHYAVTVFAEDEQTLRLATAAWQIALATVLAMWLNSVQATKIVVTVAALAQLLVGLLVIFRGDSVGVIALSLIALAIAVAVATLSWVRGVVPRASKVTHATESISPWKALDEGNDPTL